MSKAEAKREFSEKKGQLSLWVGTLLPPLSWAAHVLITYQLSEFGCVHGNYLPIHIASAVLLLLSLIGGFLSWSHWNDVGGAWKTEDFGVVPRSRFMSILGVMFSALFSLLIIGQWLPTLTGVPCLK